MPDDVNLRRATTLTGAAVVACVPVTLAVAAFAGELGAVAGSTDGTGLAMALTYGLAGWWVGSARPRNLLGWLLLLLGGCNGVAAAASTYARLAADRSLPAATVAAVVGSSVWVFGFAPLLTVLLPLAPTGTARGAGRRVLVGLGAAGPVLLAAGLASSADAIHDVVPGATNPVAAGAVSAALAVAGGVLTAAMVVVAVADALRRLLRATSPEREQLAWLLTTLVAAFAGGMVPPPARIVPLALVPLAVAVGVVRHRLLDLQVVVRRTLVYAALTAAIVTVFVGTTVLAGLAAAPRPVPVAAAAALVAVALDPVRGRLQRAVDRLVYGARRDPVQAVAQLGRRVNDQDEHELLPSVVEAVATALRAPGAACLLDGRPTVTVGAYAATADELRHPLSVAGRRLGTLAVTPRGPRERWSTADRELLDVLAPQVAVVARAVALAEEVAQSRDAVVEATRAERERLRGELHDGLGPALAGLALGLDAAEPAVRTKPGTAEDLIRRLRTEARATTEEVRRIIDGLRPDVLDEHGLDGALRQQGRLVEERSSGRLAVEVTTPESLPPLPPDVEAAAHRVAAEALANVVRHARARRCTVDLAATKDELVLRVHDDGVGLPDEPRDGVGLGSMRRRVETLGGTFRVGRGPRNGTLLEAAWPLAVRR
ncbi:MAG TPA: histidine kinase [Frankiaceae bacterium]|nr:histidine kinase [Frankiaceae bacterium]